MSERWERNLNYASKINKSHLMSNNIKLALILMLVMEPKAKTGQIYISIGLLI